MPAQNAAPQLSSGPRFLYNQLRDTYTIAGQEHSANARMFKSLSSACKQATQLTPRI